MAADETANHTCVMLVPLFDGPMVFTLTPPNDSLRTYRRDADPATTARGGVGAVPHGG